LEREAFEDFGERVGEGIRKRIGNITGKEEREIKMLVSFVMDSEVEWPSERKIQEALERRKCMNFKEKRVS
jgi:hypothetical protein